MLCGYKDVFGKPGTGFHSVRLFDVAILDVVGTVLLALAAARLTGAPIALAMVAMFALGIVAHRMFCVNTRVNVALFGHA
jgi:hypothetical protein